MINSTADLSELSKYRAPIMGLAIVLILFHHLSFLGVEFSNSTLKGIRAIGACGVDIFLILSSFGLTYSLNKCSQIESFYKKRALRILPSFLLSLLAVLLLNSILAIRDGGDIKQIASMLISTPRFHLYCMWYIFALIPFYSIFPYIHSYVMGGGKIDKQCRNLLIISVLNSFLFICASYDFGVRDFYGTILLTLFRIPIFFCGLYLMAMYKPIVRIYNSHFVFIASFIIALYSPPYIRYLAFFFLSISCLKYLVTLFEKCSLLESVFRKIGGITLELYLAHMCVYTRIDWLHIENTGLRILVALSLSIAFALVLHFISRWIVKKIECNRL